MSVVESRALGTRPSAEFISSGVERLRERVPITSYNARMKLQRTCTTTHSERAIDALARIAPELSKQQLKQAMQKGAVWLKPANRRAQKRLRRITHALKPGDTLALHYDDDLLARVAAPATLIADEQEYSVWDKPAGLLAQGTLYGDHCSLLYAAEQHFTPYRAALPVHRLDSAARGLMLVAHTPRAAAKLSALFQQRALTKRYRVIVAGSPDSAITTIAEPLDGKEAITHIESVTGLPGDRSELVVRIDTGRKHQIRRHLALIGHPVIGDTQYGSAVRNEPLQLIATELAFTCPLTNRPRHYTVKSHTIGA